MLSETLQRFSDWYLAALADGGYWLIAALMAAESTLVPIPSELVVPAAAYLAYRDHQLSIGGIILASTVGSFVGASIMYWASRWLGRLFVMRYGVYVGLSTAKVEQAERWAARFGWAGTFFARLLPVVRHLIGIPAGILRMDFRWYALATLAGSALWSSVLAWLGISIGRNAAALHGSLTYMTLAVLTVAAVLAALYYFFVHRPTRV
jgi:membrane protein DedA with SNARE-associated domain